jgi:hypothetical protein
LEKYATTFSITSEWRRFLKACGLVTVVYGVLGLLDLVLGVLAIPVHQAVSTSAGLQAVNSNTLVWEGFSTVGVLVDVLNLVVFVALYFTLRQVDQGASALALVTTIASSTVDLAINVPLNLGLVGLGRSYAAAGSDVEKAAYLATTELTLNATHVGGEIAGLLFGIAMIFVSYAMLESHAFGSGAVYTGMLSGIAWLAYAIPIPAVGIFFLLLASLCFGIWALLTGHRLYMLCSESNIAG